ncbi:hypothetical protein JCM10212_002074 [Sporobolomyces blumeae]
MPRTPSKRTPSSKAKGKRKASPPRDSATPARRSARHPRATYSTTDAALDRDSASESESEHDGEPTTFVTASAGDAYLLYSAQTSKTSDALLSTDIDPAFSLASYHDALAHFDSTRANDDARELQEVQVERARDKFPRWTWDLEQGFNLALVGLGTKRTVLNDFGEHVRTKGNVVVVNGYDPACAIGDVVTALEDIIRLHVGAADEQNSQLEGESVVRTPKKRARGGGATPKSTPRKRQATASKAGPSLAVASVAASRSARPVSALESRARKVCTALATVPATSGARPFPPIFLVVHSLDAPSLRLPKNISLLALLASQRNVHLIASIDHVRAPFLFPTALATSRPAYPSNPDPSALDPSALLHRSFNFVYYTIQTLLPYTVETTCLSTLSSLVPPSIYPPPLASSSALSSSSLIQSTIHVLASVTERAKRLFNLLARQQVAIGEMLDRAQERALNLNPKEGDKSPIVAVSINSFKNLATDLLIATHPDQVSGLLSEFKDHHVVLSSPNAPEIVPGINDDDDEQEGDGGGQDASGGEWVWVPLEREGLEEVLEELGIDE